MEKIGEILLRLLMIFINFGVFISFFKIAEFLCKDTTKGFFVAIGIMLALILVRIDEDTYEIKEMIKKCQDK